MQKIVEHKRAGIGVECSMTADERIRNANNWRTKFLALISEGIRDFLEFKNRRSLMNDTQVAQTASIIYDEYPMLTVSDVSLFFRMCKIGRFGEMVDLDGTTIIRWCDKYRKERYDALNNYYYQLEQQEKECKKAEEPTASPQEVQETIERLKSSTNAIMVNVTQDTTKPTPADTIQSQIAKIRLQVIKAHNDELLKDITTYEVKMNELINSALKEAGLNQ